MSNRELFEYYGELQQMIVKLSQMLEDDSLSPKERSQVMELLSQARDDMDEFSLRIDMIEQGGV